MWQQELIRATNDKQTAMETKAEWVCYFQLQFV